jgi:glycosyltransferase involved in cell wall biosynthesis
VVQMQKKTLKILFLEPFYGGSHKIFADGLIKNTSHEMDLLPLPARFWKWRMRGAALYFIKKIKDLQHYDLIITSGLMSSADFKAMAGTGCPPVLVYFHENQFSYPLAEGEKMDYQFGFTDITSALAADRILFNSQSHMDAFFDHMQSFIQKMPDFRPTWVASAIREKTFVCHPGCEIKNRAAPGMKKDTPPVVIWNHRWEHDKNPEAFFNAMENVKNQGIDFSLAVLGERFTKNPHMFDIAKERFNTRIVAFGYEADRIAYMQWLERGTIVVSTAIQENFGFSIVEATACGCLPIVPNRLSYPEIIPESFHGMCLYQSDGELFDKLCYLLKNFKLWEEESGVLSRKS